MLHLKQRVQHVIRLGVQSQGLVQSIRSAEKLVGFMKHVGSHRFQKPTSTPKVGYSALDAPSSKAAITKALGIGP